MSESTRRPERTGSGQGRPDRTGTASGRTTTSPGAVGSPPARTGRRERPRSPLGRQSFLERNRSRLVIVGAGIVLVAAAAFVYIGATSKAYACTVMVTPAPAVSTAPGESPEIGQAEPDMGRTHINPGVAQTYTYCPPASGNHVNLQGKGPIQPRYYGPDDALEPQGWIHNMEHGGLVVLYSCAGGCPDDATLARLEKFASVATFPASPICHIPAGVVGPVVGRFDDMSTKFAAMIWDRIVLLDTFDSDKILAFFQRYGDTTTPEQQVQCSQVSPSPEPSAEPSAGPSAAPSESGSPAPSASPSPSPSPS